MRTPRSSHRRSRASRERGIRPAHHRLTGGKRPRLDPMGKSHFAKAEVGMGVQRVQLRISVAPQRRGERVSALRR